MVRPTIKVANRDAEGLNKAIKELNDYANGLYNDVINRDLAGKIISDLLSFKYAPMSEDDKWNVISKYADIQFANMASNSAGQNYMLHKYVEGKFNCYCFLVDYNKMHLPWPDGFQNPLTRVAGQAPIAVNDNYLFYCHNNQLHYLAFGQCEEKCVPISDGENFNKVLLPVAIENEKLENQHDSIKLLIALIEDLTLMKHGSVSVGERLTNFAITNFEKFINVLANNGHTYQLDSLGTETCDVGTHFPYKFCVTKDGVPTKFEEILDDLIC